MGVSLRGVARQNAPACGKRNLWPPTCGPPRGVSPDIDGRATIRHDRRMFFDLKLWHLTAGLRGRILLSALLGLLALAVGIARFAFLGRFLAGMFQQHVSFVPLVGAAIAILLRMGLDHSRTMIAYRTASQVQ